MTVRKREYLGAWVTGVAAVSLPWLAIRFVPVEVNKWASIYIAGAIGGLALELLLGRGRIELPSPSTPTSEDKKTDERRPLGPMLDLGFFARMASSGIASVAMLVVYFKLVDKVSDASAFNKLASDPSTFGWALFFGASSPAVWTAAQRMVQSRIDAVTAVNSAQLDQALKSLKLAVEEIGKAKSAPTAPEPGQQANLVNPDQFASNQLPRGLDSDSTSRVLGILEGALNTSEPRP
jgi:hypothetical protein